MKKHMNLAKSILVTIILAVTASLAHAQTKADTSDAGYSASKVRISKKSTPKYPSYKAIGFNFSPTSGLGFMYRQMDSRVGVELVFLPIYVQGKMEFLSVGFSGVYKLKKNIYTGVSTSYWQIGKSQSVNASVNFGIEGNYEGIGAKLGTGYGIYDISSKFSTLPTIDFGLYLLLGK
jgi:hypothetical protein